MKVRIGFVSNSSSSSFCAIMYHGPKLGVIWEALGLPEDPTYEDYYKKFEDYDYGRYRVDDDLLIFESSWGGDCIGMEIGNTLGEGQLTVPECKEKFCKLIKKKFNVEIDVSKVFWEYGEWGEG